MKADAKTIENGGEKLTEAPVDTTQEVEASARADVVEREVARVVPPAAVTPPEPTPLPDPDADGRHDLRRSGYYLNRELTWLNFNFRVLNEAEDDRVPLLERVKFIAIVSSNIDEFFMKRIGGLKQQRGAGIQDRTIDGRTPEDQLEACRPLVRRLEEQKYRALLCTLDEMAQHGIVITTYEHLTPSEQDYLRDYYTQNIFPLVTPQATDPAHPFPFITNLSLNLLVTLRYPNETATSLARVQVPVGAGIPRFLRLEDRDTFVPLESVMAHNLDLLFPGMEIDGCEQFRITRNANAVMDEEEADDLLALIETGLRERKFAPVVRMEVAVGMAPQHQGRLAAEFGLDEQKDVTEVEGFLALRDVMEIADLKYPSLHDPKHSPVDHPDMKREGSIFHAIRDHGPFLLHHPYQSFATSVERFLREASEDPKVRAIKMTLYRTSATTNVVGYLVDAARNGKQVAVMLELKARFDEAANIRWANDLEEAGVHVTYGVMGLKTHCKATLVVRQDHDRLRRYAHVSTGNYHAETARLYTDLGLLTSDEDIGHDLTELFNYLTTGYKPKRNYIKLFPAPKYLKQALLDKIGREILAHSEESPGLIQFKINALSDGEITKALYEASQSGVKVDLIVRDTCRLRPGIPGLSDNVRVMSTVGRFLEHSRVFYFRNGGGEKSEYYIGSADCMKRNLDDRVEILIPVEEPPLIDELRAVLDSHVNDQRSTWDMAPDGSYVQRRPKEGSEAQGTQETLIDLAEMQLKEATRLRKRKPRSIGSRNLR
ncbi:MAG: polyphosphate kinase 1 [Gemmatimonadetes bacterium]|nr:polyphosphate kinase 1 [Gemmatimonadota bacterium]